MRKGKILFLTWPKVYGTEREVELTFEEREEVLEEEDLFEAALESFSLSSFCTELSAWDKASIAFQFLVRSSYKRRRHTCMVSKGSGRLFLFFLKTVSTVQG